MNISVDAGTRETFKKVKGADVFDKVWGNIKKYVECGVYVTVKYVFLPENSDKANVEGFVKETLNSGVGTIVLSVDFRKTDILSLQQAEMFAYMTKLAESKGINTVVNPFVWKSDMDMVNKAMSFYTSTEA